MSYFKDAKNAAKAYKANVNNSGSSPSNQQPKWNVANITFITIIFIAIIGAFVSNQNSGENDESYWCKTNPSIPAFSKECGSESTSQAVVDNSWIPANFDSWYEDSNVAYRWLKGSEFECGYGDACWGIMVISKSGCPNGLYAELSLLDKNEVQVGYTNESLSSSLPLQKSKMIFETFEESAQTGRLTEIKCY